MNDNGCMSDVSPITKYLFSCSQCGQLFFVVEQRRTKKGTGAPLVKIPVENASGRMAGCVTIQIDEFTLGTNIKINQPICPICREAWIKNTRSKMSLYYSALRTFSEIPPINPLESFNEVMERIKPFSEPPQREPEEVSQHEEPSLQFIKAKGIIHPGGFMFPKVSSFVEHGMLMLPVVFKIEAYRHFGTINGLRLGQDVLGTVVAEEFDSAFELFLHMIRTIAKVYNIGGFDQLQRPAFSDMKSRRSLEHFNKLIETIFIFCAFLIDKTATSSGGTPPPFGIVQERKTIGGYSYVFNKKNPILFTHAMKCLLINFKFLQTQFLRRAVSNP